MQHNKRGQMEGAEVSPVFLVSSYKLDIVRSDAEGDSLLRQALTLSSPLCISPGAGRRTVFQQTATSIYAISDKAYK